MTYLVDHQGLIYWTLGAWLQERAATLRVVLSYVPTFRGHRKCVVHGYDFECGRLQGEFPGAIADRVISLRQCDEATGDQYLALPIVEVDRTFAPVGVYDEGLDDLLDANVLDALRKRLVALGVDPHHVRFYGRVGCGLPHDGTQGDVDIVLEGLGYRHAVERDASAREKISLEGLNTFFLENPHRLAAVKRRWSLSQLELDACGTPIQLDVKVVDTKRSEGADRLYHAESWGRLQTVNDLWVIVTNADSVLSPAPLVQGTTTDGKNVSVSSKHYMFSGMATEGDILRVTGVMDESKTRIALTDPVKHFVVPDFRQVDCLFVE